MDRRQEYTERINRVIDYIDSHMDTNLSLDQLAGISGFSRFHFHRIFHSFTGESLYDFILRLRLEKAKAMLLTTGRTITDIAFACGFNDSATFNRAFKKRYQTTPSQWKKSKIDQAPDTEIGDNSPNGHIEKVNRETRIQPDSITVHSMGSMVIAYIRHTGPFAGKGEIFLTLFRKLKKELTGQGIATKKGGSSVVLYHDPGGITDENRLRISVGVEVSTETKVRGEIGCLEIPANRYLVCEFQLKENEYGQAWKEVYRRILPEWGVEPADGISFELYPPNCYNPTKGTTGVSIYVPVKSY